MAQRRRGMKRCIVVAAFSSVALLLPHSASAACSCPSAFELRSVGSTALQNALAWQPVSGATAYVVERSQSCDFSAPTAYTLSNAINGYGDTGKSPNDKERFHAPSALATGVTYTYRVKARFADLSEQTSNCIDAQLASGPQRGVAGDLWADVVLGQPDFGQNDFEKTTAQATQWAGGVLIDRYHTPNRMYVADANHNRVLGFDHTGRCNGLVTSLTVGKPYTKSLDPSASYPDTGNSEFTDGRESIAWGISGDSFGYPHGTNSSLSVDVDVDLGVDTLFNTAVLDTGGRTDRYTASSFDLFVSGDAQQWTPVGQFDNPTRAFTLVVSFPPVTGRYVRFRVHALTGCVDCDWLFLGEGKVGYTTTIGQLCSVDADCVTSICEPDPNLTPQVVLGQPSFVDQAACNGDGTGQLYPARAPASAASLCFMHPFHLTPGETIYASMMAVDSQGALYVPDVFNHRILKYDDPFSSDAIADDVWGQADFAGNACNRGNGSPAANTLCLIGYAPHSGVAIDGQGNLWAADPTNARVLRFAKLGGSLAHDADIVLGQHTFTSNQVGSSARPLDQMAVPLDVTFDASTGRLYVADAGDSAAHSRILEFVPPFSTGMAAARKLPISFFCDFDYPGLLPLSLTMDSISHGLWVENNCFFTELFDLDSPSVSPVVRVKVLQTDGTDVNDQGDLVVVGKWSNLVQFRRADIGLDYPTNEFYAQTLFSGGAKTSGDAFRFPFGITALGTQLIAADSDRMLIWNNYAVDQLQNGQAADDVYGHADFETRTFQQYFAGSSPK